MKEYVLPVVFLIGIIFNVLEFINAWKGLLIYDETIDIVQLRRMRTHCIGAVWDFIFMLIFLP